MNDYVLFLEIRSKMHERHHPREESVWSPFKAIDPLLIPFDAPMHSFQVGERCLFRLRADQGLEYGQIMSIDTEAGSACVQKEDAPKVTKLVMLDKLFQAARYRMDIVELIDWTDVYRNLFFSSSSTDALRMFALLSNALRDYVHEQEEEEEQERDYCLRFLSFEIVQFLFDDDQRSKAMRSLSCGLCPEQNHHRVVMSCKSFRSTQLETVMSLQRQGIDDNFDPVVLDCEVRAMCDICMVTFHPFDYLYSCSTTNVHDEHDVCLSCMNRYVLENKRLTNTLNGLHGVHGLSQDCILEIVYFVIGWIHCDWNHAV